MEKVWCQSLEGGAFDLLHPMPEMISWHTVSVVLGRIPRFGGHTLQGTYSVAQHSVEGARAILHDHGNRSWAAAFLLHDVHEAYIGDIMTPVSRALQELAIEEYGCTVGGWIVKSALDELKHRIDRAVYEKAGIELPSGDTAEIIKDYDARMAVTERSERLSPPPLPWHPTIENKAPIPDVDLTPWSSELATSMFRSSLRELLPSGRTDIDIPAPSDACGCDECAVDYRKVWS